MQAPEIPTSRFQTFSRHLMRWRRPLLWVLGVGVALLLLVNGLLATGTLGSLLSHGFERMTVTWEHGWSLWPDHVHVKNLRIWRRESNGDTWELRMESAEVNLSLSSLFRRRLEADSVLVRGLRVRLEIGANPAGTGPQEGVPKEPWAIVLRGVRVEGVRELAWGNNVLTGIAEATGEMELVPGLSLAVRDAHARLGEGELTHRGGRVAHIEEGTATCDIEAGRDETGALDVASGLSGRLQLSATLPSVTTFQRWVPQLAEAELEGGAGRLRADVRVKEGRIEPESVMDGSGEPVTLPVGLLRVRAPWRFHGEVRAKQDGQASAGIQLVLAPVKLEGRKGQVLETSELKVSLESPAPRLGEPLHDVHASLHVAQSDPLDLRVLNDWLGQAFEVDSGQARLEGSTRAHPSDGGGTAHLELKTEGLQAHWGGAKLGGSVALEIDARKLALHHTTVTFDGSQLLLRDISVRTRDDQERHWDGTLSFPDATLKLSPAVLEGRFTGSFSNAAPFIALLTAKTSLPHVLSPLLQAKDLKLSGAVMLESSGAKVEKLRVDGDGLELRGGVELAGESAHAVLLVKVGVLPLGVEVTSDGTHVQVMHPYDWYQEKTGEKAD